MGIIESILDAKKKALVRLDEGMNKVVSATGGQRVLAPFIEARTRSDGDQGKSSTPLLDAVLGASRNIAPQQDAQPASPAASDYVIVKEVPTTGGMSIIEVVGRSGDKDRKEIRVALTLNPNDTPANLDLLIRRAIEAKAKDGGSGRTVNLG